MVGDIADAVGGHGDDVAVVDVIIDSGLYRSRHLRAVILHVLPAVKRGLAHAVPMQVSAWALTGVS